MVSLTEFQAAPDVIIGLFVEAIDMEVLTEECQGGPVTACFHVLHLHRIHVFFAANCTYSSLEIKSMRITKVVFNQWSEEEPLPLLALPPPPPLSDRRASNSVEWSGNQFLSIPPMTGASECGMLTAAHRDLSSIMGGRRDHLVTLFLSYKHPVT
ncbi:unnamed protein product [Hymenolepis diminuta]|uniref:Uncharacterized protein n=1 Tax=Hymenolepis diminuta TaxID=6216 RepID=A0A0R3SWS7_HYMDI|nr:unnamed protein product [Hymenolepis diminuta]